jgi:hypothetical protein
MARARLFYWKAKRAHAVLVQMRADVEEYFKTARWSPRSGWHETPRAKELRNSINLNLVEANNALAFVAQGRIVYQPPASTGGLAGDVSLLDNIFNLPRLQLPHDHLVDNIDRAIGTYKSWLEPLWWRLFNPFYWIGHGIAWVADLPFRVLRRAGIDTRKAEASTWGKTLKAVLEVLTGLGAIIGFLKNVEFLRPMVNAVGTFFGY